MILHQGVTMGDALKPGKIMVFLHQGKFNKISETNNYTCDWKLKKYMFFNAVPWNSMERGVHQFRWYKKFHWIPWNSMELENRMKNSQLNIFLGCQSWHCFGLSGKSSWFFQHPRSLIYANSDFWCSVDAPICKYFAIMRGTEGNG